MDSSDVKVICPQCLLNCLLWPTCFSAPATICASCSSQGSRVHASGRPKCTKMESQGCCNVSLWKPVRRPNYKRPSLMSRSLQFARRGIIIVLTFAEYPHLPPLVTVSLVPIWPWQIVPALQSPMRRILQRPLFPWV
jgi:hypothetical protein